MPHGEATIYSQREGETFHCGLGPVAEAKLLYVDQLELDTRWKDTSETNPWVVWDVGLGAGANTTAVLNSWKASSSGHLHLVSFDRSLGALTCALEDHRKNPTHFAYLEGWDWDKLIRGESIHIPGKEKSLLWEWKLGDFVEGLTEALAKQSWPRPRSILYDSYSPARNFEMWKLEHWIRLRQFCGDGDTTAVSYSRATGVRVTLALAGFYLGRGCATGAKEETTLIATDLKSLRAPLDHRWLDRVGRSHTSEPFTSKEFQVSPITEQWLSQLKQHPQFSSLSSGLP